MSRPIPAGFAVAATASAALAQFTFFQPLERSNFSLDPGAVLGMVVADVDGDGIKDLLLRGAAGPQWYRNDGKGIFTVRPLPSAPILVADSAVGDIDGDGDDDLYYLVLYRNLGGGQFVLDTASMPPQFIGRMGHFVAVDVGGDGDTDIVITTGAAAQALLLRNNGNGTFVRVTLTGLGPPTAYFVLQGAGDVDGDGTVDLLAVGPPDLWLLNDGTGGFTAKIIDGLPPLTDARLFDLDRDGLADLSYSAQGNCWLRNLGNLRFRPKALPVNAAAPGPLAFADFDGDGDLDLVMGGPRMRILFNDRDSFHAGLQNVVMQTPFPGNALAGADVRIRPGPPGARRIDVAWVKNGQPVLLCSPDDNGSATFWPVHLPTTATATRAAVFDDGSPDGRSLLVVQATGISWWKRSSPVAVVDQSSRVHVLGTPAGIACGDLAGSGVDQVVVGARSVAGPQILSLDAAGNLQAVAPTLPPAPGAAHALAEVVHLADVDGDGDLDILHEMRVVLNQGNGTWSAGADFSALVPTTAIDYLPFDLDGDGDQDLVVWTPATVSVLENRGTSFVPFAMPQISGTTFATVSIGDIDRDGDLDLLVVDFVRDKTTLLRNDGGQFTVLTDISPSGILIDTDDDLDPDLFRGDVVAHNLFCQLSAPTVPQTGGNYHFDLHSWRFGAPAVAAFVAIGQTTTAADLGLAGTLRVGPSGRIVIGFPLGLGLGAMTFAIPANPTLRGMSIESQALFFDQFGGLRLSNHIHDVIR